VAALHLADSYYSRLWVRRSHETAETAVADAAPAPDRAFLPNGLAGTRRLAHTSLGSQQWLKYAGSTGERPGKQMSATTATSRPTVVHALMLRRSVRRWNGTTSSSTHRLAWCSGSVFSEIRRHDRHPGGIRDFAVGFIARPFGGLFFGHFATVWRKPMLVITLLLVGGGTS